MEKRRIGSLEVSIVGLGCNNFGWRIDAVETARVIDAALDAGINFLDTADIYGSGESEEFIGQALGGRRDRVIIATKFGSSMGKGREGASPDYIPRALDDSLKRLRTEYVDLYQLHRPDAKTPIGETLEALDTLVKAGKVREIGVSNFSAEQIREAVDATRSGAARVASLQNEYSLMHREPEADVLPECERLGIAFLPYFPLANGLLTGKYRSGQPLPHGSRAQAGWGPKVFTRENLAIADRLRDFAESRGHSLLELAFAWLASHNVVASVIAGAKSPEQVRANAKAADWKLDHSDLAAIEQIVGRYSAQPVQP